MYAENALHSQNKHTAHVYLLYDPQRPTKQYVIMFQKAIQK